MVKINLLAEKRPKKKKVKGPVNFLIILAAATLSTLLVMGGVTYFLKAQVSRLKATEEENNVKVTKLKKDIEEVKKFEALNNDLKRRSAIIETLRKNQSVPVRILDEVSRIIPEGVWITSLSYKESGVVIEGVAFTNIDIVAYIENLKRSGNMSDVYLEETRELEIEKVKVYRFRLNFKIKI